MSLERVFAKIIFYCLELAAKGIASFFVYSGLISFTGNTLGSMYIAGAVFMFMIILAWNAETIAYELAAPYEKEYSITEEIE